VLLAPPRAFDYLDDLPGDEPRFHGSELVALDWSADQLADPGLSPAEPVTTDKIMHRCALVLLEADGTHLRQVDITFSERVVTTSRSRISGGDRSGSFLVVLEGEVPPTRLHFHFKYQQVASATPEELLPAVELLDGLQVGRRLGLWSLTTGQWAAEPVAIPEDHPRLPAGYSSTVGALARVQRHTGLRFPMPEEITDDDATALRRADTLLSGATLAGRWQHLDVELDAGSVDVIRSATSDLGAVFEFTSDYAVQIAGRTVVLGSAEHRFRHILLEDARRSEGSAALIARLVPGQDDRFEIRLLSRIGRSIAVEELNAYAGRWIAQDGTGVVEAGESAAEVVAALRRSGRKGSLWRVPRTRAEAEAVVSG